MTQQSAPSISELLKASQDDESTMQLPVPDRPFGFHAQQAIEKLLKALIVAHGLPFKYTHDLDALLERTVELGERVPVHAFIPGELTRFAGVWRYESPDPFSPDERKTLLEAVRLLRVHVLERIAIVTGA